MEFRTLEQIVKKSIFNWFSLQKSRPISSFSNSYSDSSRWRLFGPRGRLRTELPQDCLSCVRHRRNHIQQRMPAQFGGVQVRWFKKAIICHCKLCSNFHQSIITQPPFDNAYRFRPPISAEGPRREVRRRRPFCGSHIRAVERVIEFSDVRGFRSRWWVSYHLTTLQKATVTWQEAGKSI